MEKYHTKTTRQVPTLCVQHRKECVMLLSEGQGYLCNLKDDQTKQRFYTSPVDKNTLIALRD